MTPCEAVTLVNALTCTIANCVDDSDQLSLLAAIFVQLGDSLATYITYQSTCCTTDEEDNQTVNQGTNTTFL